VTTTTPVDADTGEILVRPFAAFLQDRAASHQELSDRLHELIAAVIDTGKAGVLTYKVTLKPLKGSAQLFVTDEITEKRPEHERPTSIFFVDGTGNLSRHDPHQLAIDGLREVPARPVREA
jgi:hypothetical protein